MRFFTIRMPDGLISLIKTAAVIIGAKNVSEFVRGVLANHCHKVLREKGIVEETATSRRDRKKIKDES